MNIPEGYRQAADGNLVPIAKIKPIDLARDELVQEIVSKARDLNGIMTDFKTDTFADIAAFVQLSAEQYGAKLGGEKGNVTLYSFDGKYKIQRAMSENIVFDERLQAAKALIDACINKWSEGINDNIHVLVNDAFRVDKEGKISTGRVLGLRRLNITDPEWLSAMNAISESLQVIGTKAYIRIYEREGEGDKYVPLSLDLAGA
jgi:hypothetical protein